MADTLKPEARVKQNEIIENALWALVRAELRGSKTTYKEAAKEVGLTFGQMEGYRSRYADRYFQIRGELSREMRLRVAAENETLSLAYAKAEVDALALIQEGLNNRIFEPRELALISKNLSMNKMGSATTARQARGDHEVIRVEHSAEDLIKSLAALMPTVFASVEAEVEVIHPAEVIHCDSKDSEPVKMLPASTEPDRRVGV